MLAIDPALLGRIIQAIASENTTESGRLTVDGLCQQYLDHARQYYRKGGRPTTEPANIELALRPLRRLYGPSPAWEFGPRKLKAVRQAMIEGGLSRNEINKRVGKVRRCFKWAAEEELLPPSVHHGLATLAGLRKDRSMARESRPIRPAPEAHVAAVRPFVSRQVWAMIELQRLTGMRPGEACSMRTGDLDVSGAVWVYRPGSHKTEHHGRERDIYLGPAAQEVLRPWLRMDRDAHLFQPREAMAERRVLLRQRRKTPVQPSQQCRAKESPLKKPGTRYTKDSYRGAIARACRASGVPRWHPHQLRHNAATRLRRDFGLDVARAVLGHTSPVVTEVYAEIDREKARDVMGRVG